MQRFLSFLMIMSQYHIHLMESIDRPQTRVLMTVTLSVSGDTN